MVLRLKAFDPFQDFKPDIGSLSSKRQPDYQQSTSNVWKDHLITAMVQLNVPFRNYMELHTCPIALRWPPTLSIPMKITTNVISVLLKKLIFIMWFQITN